MTPMDTSAQQQKSMQRHNAFSVDVEDYFQVNAFADIVRIDQWPNFESRVVRNTRVVMDLLAQANVKATFFVLGWVAQREPHLVREIAAAGHEIASHGMSHQLIYKQTPEVFREETLTSKKLLEDQAQCEVIGYRAASYSITSQSLWALDILCEAGFQYDSSIFPMRHDTYGIPDAQAVPHRLRAPSGAEIVEFPISVADVGPMKLPVGGGGYFRLLPYPVTRWGLKRINALGRDFVFYIHPWEIDPEQPRMAGARLFSRFRHYNNLNRCSDRLRALLSDFKMTTVRESLRAQSLLP